LSLLCAFYVLMEHEPIFAERAFSTLDLPKILGRVAEVSTRPRYTMMVLTLINGVADDRGRAGPWVREGEMPMTVREWLSDAMAPLAARSHKRLAMTDDLRTALAAEGRLPEDPEAATRALEEAVRERARASGLTSVSRAVTELVQAGLLGRHYQGYRVDHANRGAQRHAVYTVPAAVRAGLAAGPRPSGRPQPATPLLL
jgi:hypothetical protein